MICKRILLVVDDPDGFGRNILHKVAQLAAALDAEVAVFDTVFDSALVDHAKVQRALQRRRSDLELTAEALRQRSVRAHAMVRWASPPRDGILHQMEEYHPDLLIITSQQRSTSQKRSRLARMLFTYSDYKLIETAPCPIFIIKNDRLYEDSCVIAAVDPMHMNDKPAALDELIVDAGSTVAEALRLPLRICHAIALVPPGLPSEQERLRDIPAAIHEDLCGAWQARAESRVRLLAESARVPDERIHIAPGDPATMLPELAAECRAGLLVMGAVSRSWVRKALIGYTAEKVLDEMDCDLLIVKLPA